MRGTLIERKTKFILRPERAEKIVGAMKRKQQKFFEQTNGIIGGTVRVIDAAIKLTNCALGEKQSIAWSQMSSKPCLTAYTNVYPIIHTGT